MQCPASRSLGLLIITHSCSPKNIFCPCPKDKARPTSYSFPTNSVWTDLRKTPATYGSAWPGIVWFFCSSVRPHLFSILKTRSVLTWKQPAKALVIFHQTVTSQWPIFFFHSFFFQLRLIKWSSCLFFPLPPEAENTDFEETYSSFASLPLFPASMDGQPWEGWSSQRGPLCQQGSPPAPVGMAAGCQPLGSQAQLGHTCQGMGTANGSDTCWLTTFLLGVWRHAVSSPCFHWKFWVFSMRWWHRNNLSVSVHWPNEPG